MTEERSDQRHADGAARTSLEDAERLSSDMFFIIGTGRCGTTLLQAMLSCHGRIHVTPETKFFAFLDPRRFVGDPVPSEAALDRHLHSCAQMWYWRDLDLDDARIRSDTLAGGMTARAMFLAILAQCHERSPKPRIGEKTPGHFKEVARISSLFPGARFVHMYRDPRDVVASMLRHGWAEHDSAQQHARSWTKTMRADSEYASTLGEKYLPIRYETLVHDPEGELRRVCDFLGEDFDEAMLLPEQRLESGFGESEMAWKGDTLGPLSGRGIGRYREDLSDHQIRTIERVAGAWLGRMGYERDDSVRTRPSWALLDSAERARWWLWRQSRSLSKRFGARDPYDAMRSSAMPSIRRV